MKILLNWIAVTIAVVTIGFAQELEPTRLAPGDLEWNGAPGEVTVVDIAGDNEIASLYVYRVRFPGGFRNEPHYHPDDRVVTVMAGTLHMGYGNEFDENAMQALPVGSVWPEPGEQPHFVWAQDGEVVIQVVGFGPSGTTQIEP